MPQSQTPPVCGGEVEGSVLLGFVKACRNLHVISPGELEELAGGIEPAAWYPLERIHRFENVIVAHFHSASSILEQAGIDFARQWYEAQGSKAGVCRGVDFLKLQTGSEGYARVVRGDTAQVGRFELIQLDESLGTAIVQSSTPFSRDFERGLLTGGMLAPGDLCYVKVSNAAPAHRFLIAFKGNASWPDQNCAGDIPTPPAWKSRPEYDAAFVDRLYWRYQGLLEEQRRDRSFWQATNLTLERIAQKLHELSRQMEDLAYQDHLTGLANRRSILKRLEQEYARSVRYEMPLSLGILDLDWFKRINDTCGHLVGDAVLKCVASVLSESLRMSDSIGRLSGEEFLLIFPGTPLPEAVQAANKLREEIARIDFPHESGRLHLSASLGVAERTADTEHMTELLRRADFALYIAKKGGRNRVEKFVAP